MDHNVNRGNLLRDILGRLSAVGFVVEFGPNYSPGQHLTKRVLENTSPQQTPTYEASNASRNLGTRAAKLVDTDHSSRLALAKVELATGFVCANFITQYVRKGDFGHALRQLDNAQRAHSEATRLALEASDSSAFESRLEDLGRMIQGGRNAITLARSDRLSQPAESS